MLVLNAHIGEVRSLSFASDGVHLAEAGGPGNRLALWHLTRNQREHRAGGKGNFNRVTFAPRGLALVGRQQRGTYLWADPFARARPIAHWASGASAFHPQGTEVACTAAAGPEHFQIEFRSTTDGTPSRDSVLVPLPRGGDFLAWTSTALFIARMRFDSALSRYLLELVRVDAGVTITHLATKNHPHFFAVSPDGRTLAGAGNIDTIIERWDLGTGQPLPALTEHNQPTMALAHLPDGRLLSCSKDGIVRTWDHASGKCLDVKDWRMNGITALAVAPDGMRAAVGNQLGSILIWDLD
jgi:hypothetical protein